MNTSEVAGKDSCNNNQNGSTKKNKQEPARIAASLDITSQEILDPLFSHDCGGDEESGESWSSERAKHFQCVEPPGCQGEREEAKSIFGQHQGQPNNPGSRKCQHK